MRRKETKRKMKLGFPSMERGYVEAKSGEQIYVVKLYI